MKNKLYKIIFTVMAVIMTALPTFAKTAQHLTTKTIMIKFSIAMCGVMLFSFIIYLGLCIYNKFFVDDQIKNFNLRKNSLRTPRDKDEAIMMFIVKNRLR